MPKPTKGARLGGGPAHERLMLNQMAAQLFEHKRIQTTETKAKRLQPLAERLVTFAKRGDLHSRRRVMRRILDKSVVHELFTEIAPLVEDREGGYTRIVKTGYRKGDRAPMAVIELVLEPVQPKARPRRPLRSRPSPRLRLSRRPHPSRRPQRSPRLRLPQKRQQLPRRRPNRFSSLSNAKAPRGFSTGRFRVPPVQRWVPLRQVARARRSAVRARWRGDGIAARRERCLGAREAPRLRRGDRRWGSRALAAGDRPARSLARREEIIERGADRGRIHLTALRAGVDAVFSEVLGRIRDTRVPPGQRYAAVAPARTW